MSRIVRLFSVAVLALVLTACADDDPAEVTGPPEGVEAPAPPDEEVTVEEEVLVRAVEVGPYQDVPQQVTAGVIEFRLVNEDDEDDEPHDFRIEELDEGTQIIDPGESDTLTVELEPGSYTFYCSVPGHREAGMAGQLEVLG